MRQTLSRAALRIVVPYIAVTLAYRLIFRGLLNWGLPARSDLWPGLPEDIAFTVLTSLFLYRLFAGEIARLYREAQQTAALDERQRLARELHDSVSQALYGIALGTQAVQEMVKPDNGRTSETLRYVLSLAKEALSDMRALIFELQPQWISQGGLVGALEKQARAVQANYGIDVFTFLGNEPDIPLGTKETLFRIAHQALQNVVQHARTGEAELRLECHDGIVMLEVCDAGVGFDAGAVVPGHLGLESMRSRAASLGGTLQVDSSPGNGTSILVQIPFR